MISAAAGSLLVLFTAQITEGPGPQEAPRELE